MISTIFNSYLSAAVFALFIGIFLAAGALGIVLIAVAASTVAAGAPLLGLGLAGAVVLLIAALRYSLK
jgi:hypothetical protein